MTQQPTKEDREFWRAQGYAAPEPTTDWRKGLGPSLDPEASCYGHVASEHDPKICGRCGTHIDGLRPDDGQQ